VNLSSVLARMAMEAGTYDYLVKPYPDGAVVAVVNLALQPRSHYSGTSQSDLSAVGYPTDTKNAVWEKPSPNR
jgi:DNA-binding response OmpR family regulator